MAEKIPLNSFTADLINAAKPEIWNDPASADDLETLGILVSKYCEWEGEKIIKVMLEALTDSNFHSLAEELKKTANDYFYETFEEVAL